MTNLEKITKGIEDRFDAVLLLSSENRQYATGLKTSSGAVLIHRGGGVFITDFRYIEAARGVPGFEVLMSDQKKSTVRLLSEAINEYRIKTLAIEENEMSVALYRKYETEFSAKLVFEGGLLSSLRASKNREEKEKVEKAVKIADAAFSDVFPMIRKGITENDIACELQYRMLKRGAERMSFDPIVVSGIRSSMPHGMPSDKKLKEGEFVTMDFGCVRDGYCSDITRTVAVGYATDEMRKIYGIVLNAQLAAIAKARAGIPAKDVDSSARTLIEMAGYGACFGHSTGHGVGLNVHEAPAVSPASKDILREGNVISAEPGIYIDGKFGVRIEDLLYITETGCEILTKTPKKLLIAD